MAGFVPYGNGGFYPYSLSSPSSLSALAPPFTVDRSVPKPMSNPLDVTETPYAAPMNSSLHNWLPSHPTATGSNFFANPTPDFNSMPSSNAYGYAGLQTVEPSNTNLPPLNTITTASSSAFKYDQSFDAAPTSFVDVKPYYPSYLSSTIPSVPPTVVPNQPSYDWLSTTHFAPLDSSSHKDYAQNPSDPKYTTQWGGLWEWEHGKQGDFSGNFCSKKTDVSGSSLYKNYLNQGMSPPSYVPMEFFQCNYFSFVFFSLSLLCNPTLFSPNYLCNVQTPLVKKHHIVSIFWVGKSLVDL